MSREARQATPAAPVPHAAAVRAVAGAVLDPELPALTLADLGILRSVEMVDGQLTVILTPTYTGCPATRVIEADVREALASAGWHEVRVETRLSPVWSTELITEEGRRKMRENGIAPPGPVLRTTNTVALVRRATPAKGWRASLRPASPMQPGADALPDCPLCASGQVECLSSHGSTACKALYRCLTCGEPFDYFKPY